MTTVAAQGYATYLPNSFGPRGYVDVCPHTARVTPDEGVQVALLAAAALATRLQKTDRVIVMECRFAVDAETGRRRHAYDYVVVCLNRRQAARRDQGAGTSRGLCAPAKRTRDPSAWSTTSST